MFTQYGWQGPLSGKSRSIGPDVPCRYSGDVFPTEMTSTSPFLFHLLLLNPWEGSIIAMDSNLGKSMK